MSKIIVVALGGALGAIARYGVGWLFNTRWPMQFPMGTFVINITGSFAIGFLTTLISQRVHIHPNWHLMIAVGFIGAYTTFSTLEYETFRLIEDGNILSAAFYTILSFTIGFIAVCVGVAAARRFYIPPEIAAGLQSVISTLRKPGSKTVD